MPLVHEILEVPYSVAQMYQLVDTVEKYPEFLPWCKGCDVLHRDEDEVHARLILSGGGFQKSFTTCNRLQENKMIEIKLLDGPFQQLEGFWKFDLLEEQGCKVTLDLEFEFSNKLLALAFGPVFHQVATTLVDAFSKRAHQLYGK